MDSNTSTTIEDRLIELLNFASVELDSSKKVESLYKIKELALNHGLLDKYFVSILAFQNERSSNVRKFVSAFIEDTCKHDVEFCPKAILSLNLLLNDSNNDVIKRSIQAANQFYKALVLWIVKSLSSTNDQTQLSKQNDSRNMTSDKKSIALTSLVDQTQNEKHFPKQNQQNIVSDELYSSIEGTWLMWLQITSFICGLLETTNNDGIRTHCIKFIETIVLMQTASEQYTDTNFELNLIDHKMIPVTLSEKAAHGCGVAGLPKNGVLFDEEHKLELVESAKKRFDQLVLFHGTSHISSVNLMATMQSLVVLAKQRYRLFMGRVLQAMESLNNRLPPTLTESQVLSVKKFLKLQLTVMLKHPYSLDRYQQQITQLLQSVGSKQPEIHKVISDFKSKYGCDASILNNNQGLDPQKRIKLEPGVKPEQKPFGSHSSQTTTVGKSKHLDLNKLTQELDEKEKRQIVVDSVKRILGEEKSTYIPPAQMEIKKKVLSTLANEFNNTECPRIIQDYIFSDLRNRHEICYAIIKKNYDVAAAKAMKRNINVLEDQELLKNYFECFNSYLSRAMELKDSEEKEIILPRLYSLKEEYYSMTNQGQESEDG